MKVAVIGTGYVGLSLATLLSTKNSVVAMDINQEKVKKINNRVSPIKDKEIEEYFSSNELDLFAVSNYSDIPKNTEYIIICTPTNYNLETGESDTTSVESIIEEFIDNFDGCFVIKSTVPVGYTEKLKEKYGINNIFFSPEFLREGNALYDNLYPSRIIIGDDTEEAKRFGNVLKECSLEDNIQVLYMTNTEAEAVKLFSNTYLAMRVAFFNELDSFAEFNQLNAKRIIDGIILDPRIGEGYCNPSFGYGGYCLPKDTKQLQKNYEERGIPQKLIKATVEANTIRKQYIADIITKKNPNCVGIYSIKMKKNSDNYRESAIIDIIDTLASRNVKVIIYEPLIRSEKFHGCTVINEFETFAEEASIILANRFDESQLRTKIILETCLKHVKGINNAE